MEEQELKPISHYEKQYDLYTIKHCQMIEQMHKEIDTSKYLNHGKNDAKLYEACSKINRELLMYFEKGEEWKRKRKTIDQWMERDRLHDQLLESAVAPKSIRCATCHDIMPSNFKTLHERDGKDAVLFFYNCPNKHRGRAFYHDGVEYVSKPIRCSHCHQETIKSERSRKGDVITTIEHCTKCDYQNVDVFDLNDEKKDEMTEQEFEQLRKQYCLTDEEGRQYCQFRLDMEGMKNIIDDVKEREENAALYQLIASIDRVTVPQLRKRIESLITQHQYSQVTFEQPLINKDVQISFSVQDESARESYDSIKTLTKLLKDNLVTTNWSLMSEGLIFRMGVLTGRFRGYDSDKDIQSLVEQRVKNGELMLPNN